MDFNIGSNVIRNTNGILKIQGKEQIVLQVQSEGHQLFLTMDLYDSGGSHIAHLRRNSWAFNTKKRFEIQATPPSESLFLFPSCVKILDKESGDVVLDVNLVEKNTIHIPQGKVYSHKGQLFEITPHCWRFPGTPTMFGSVRDVHGGVVTIG